MSMPLSGEMVLPQGLISEERISGASKCWRTVLLSRSQRAGSGSRYVFNSTDYEAKVAKVS